MYIENNEDNRQTLVDTRVKAMTRDKLESIVSSYLHNKYEKDSVEFTRQWNEVFVKG